MIPAGGLVESIAAKTHARFGYWPAFYLDMLRRVGVRGVPARVEAMSRVFKVREPKDAG